MARSQEDIVKDRLEETRLEIDRQQTIIDNDRKTFKEREAARKRQLVLIERELSIQEKIASLEERSIRLQEKAASVAEKAALAAQKALEKQEDLADSLYELLNNQIRSLNVKQSINKKLLANEELQLTLATEYQQKLIQHPEDAKRLLKEYKAQGETLADNLQIEENLVKTQKDYADAVAKVTAKIKESQLNSAKDYVKGIEDNMRKIPIIGDLMGNILMGPKTKRKLTATFFKYFRNNPALKKIIGGKGSAFATGAITALTTGFTLMSKRSEVLKDIRRTLGATNEQAVKFRDVSIEMLGDSNSMATTQAEILKSASELQGTYGEAAKTNRSLIDSQITLTKGFGLQGEEALKLNELADGTGQTYNDQLKTTIAIGQATGKVYKYNFNLNGILADVANLSSTIKATLGGSAAAMAKAVIQAKLMGVTLQQLDGVADNLLQIESSIENQVTAQLVTGRNINLDKARMLALNNDLVGVGNELMKQGIDYAAFGKMNRVEQQATAAAMGMQKDEFADMLLKQEIYKRAGADINAKDSMSLKLNDEKIAALAAQGDEEAKKYIQSQKQLSMQERMTAAMERFSTIIENIYYWFIGIGVALAAMTFGLSAIHAIGAGILGGIAIKKVGGTQMADGGFIPHTPAGTQVTMAEEPNTKGELIVPLKKYDNMVLASNGANLKSNNTNQAPPTVNVSLVVGNTAINEIGNKISMNQNYNQGVGNTYNRLG